MRIPGSYFFQNLIERRALLYQLVRRDFEQRFIGSAAGWLWGLIHPLVLLVSWTFVFQMCMKQTLPPGEVTQNYSLFLICGFLPWLLFQETVKRSASSMVEQCEPDHQDHVSGRDGAGLDFCVGADRPPDGAGAGDRGGG